MPDREKVIKGLECCIPMTTRHGIGDCHNCPYDRKITIEGGIVECCHDLMEDALALLKAQEPLMVEERADTDTINCPKCGQQFARVGRDKSVYLDLDEEPNYCWKCGRVVKWDD